MWKLVDVQIIYKKLYQRELVTSDWFFVIRNSSGVQIFRNDEKVRQRHLPKMYTLVVTMNWNRFRKIFRIRFCIFYNRSELSQCLKCVWPHPLPGNRHSPICCMSFLQFDIKFASKQQALAKISTILWLLLSLMI